MMKQQIVYLCGPITGCSYEGCTSWREYVTKELDKAAYEVPCVRPGDGIHEYRLTAPAFKCVSPMRGKEFLKELAAIPARQLGHFDPMAQDVSINARDSWDCHRCDIGFVNLLGTKIASIGSVMEISDMWNHRKYIILVMEEGNVHDHPFVRARASIILPSVERAVAYMKEVLIK